MTIKEIYHLKGISVRSLNVCNRNRLKDISSLLAYFEKHEDFYKLRNCGAKSNEELIQICKKYSSNYIPITIDTNFENKSKASFITDELNNRQRDIVNNFIQFNFTGLSTRSQNAIRLFLDGNLEIQNLSNRIFNDLSFNVSDMKSVGAKSEIELKTFFKNIKVFIEEIYKYQNENELNEKYRQYYQYQFKNEHLVSENEVLEAVSSFTRHKRDLTNSLIELLYQRLSKRSQNVFLSFLNNDLKIRNICEKLFTDDNFDLLRIRNVGVKSSNELDKIINDIKLFVIKVRDIDNEKEITKLKNQFLFQKAFQLNELPIEILESRSIFKLTDFLINQDMIFEEKGQNIILRKALKIYINQIDDTSITFTKEIGFSKERVRQIRKKCLEELFNQLQFIKSIDDELLLDYNIDASQDIIIIDEFYRDLINQKNGTTFSNEFISFLIYTFWSEDFSLIGNIEDVLQPRFISSRTRYSWNNFFLIRRGFSDEFDFDALAFDIQLRLNERIEESYSFNFKSYISKFVKSTNQDILNSVLEVAEKMINYEFGISIDLEDNIVFSRNTMRQIVEYVIDVLEILGKPSKHEEIFVLLETMHPGTTKSSESLRGSLQKSSEIIFFGRSSTFGLKKWENEDSSIKGGTIRSIVYEYLEGKNEPVHIDEIATHVLLYRPNSSKNSIWQNLILVDSNMFLFFKNAYIGIENKMYDNSFILSDESDKIQKKSWDERLTDLENFLAQNNRMPFSSNRPELEIKLYRWFKTQHWKYMNKKLEVEQAKKIASILETYEIGYRKRNTHTFERDN